MNVTKTIKGNEKQLFSVFEESNKTGALKEKRKTFIR